MSIPIQHVLLTSAQTTRDLDNLVWIDDIGIRNRFVSVEDLLHSQAETLCDANQAIILDSLIVALVINNVSASTFNLGREQ